MLFISEYYPLFVYVSVWNDFLPNLFFFNPGGTPVELSGIKSTNVVASVHPTWSPPPHFAATKFEYKYKRSRGRVISSDGKRRWAEVIKGRLRHEGNFHLTGLHVGPQPASVRISRGFRLASPRWGRGGYSAEGWRLKREESGGGSHPPIRVLLRCWLQ